MELETRVTRQLQTLCIVLHVIERRSCGPQDPPPESRGYCASGGCGGGRGVGQDSYS